MYLHTLVASQACEGNIMPVTKDPKTGKVTHHSYSPKSKTYDKAIASGQTAVANPHTGRNKAATKRSY
jgi:hypothetical protein